MNIYYAFYCRAYDWYNKTGSKSKDTLRASAVALLSAMPLINSLTILGLISVLQRHTLINKWVGLTAAILWITFNSILINTKKSDDLREEYLKLDDYKKKRINTFFYVYLIVSVLLLILMFCYTAYYKSKYGHYDI